MSDAAVSREEFEQLVERVDELEEENQQLREERDQERARREDLEDRVDELEDEVESQATVEWESGDHRDALLVSTDGTRYPLGAKMDNALTEGDVEHVVDDLLDEHSPSTGDVDDAGDALLPIQQLAALPDDVAREQLDNPAHKNTYRARNVWKDVTDYATATPRGYVLRSGELRRVLSALEDEDVRIESRTTLRVLKRIVEYSNGVVERQKRKGEWELVIPKDFEQRAKEAAGEGDSVVTG